MSTGAPGDSRHQHRIERLIEWALGPDDLQGDDVPHAVTLVTDTLAAIVAAGVEPEVRELAASAPALGGQGRATVLSMGAGTSPWAAALVNGTAAVRLELEEGNGFCANHPSAHTVPAERLPGGADRPYPPGVIREKHRALLQRGQPDHDAEALLRWCDSLPRHSSLTDLAALVGGPR